MGDLDGVFVVGFLEGVDEGGVVGTGAGVGEWVGVIVGLADVGAFVGAVGADVGADVGTFVGAGPHELPPSEMRTCAKPGKFDTLMLRTVTFMILPLTFTLQVPPTPSLAINSDSA